MEEFAPPDPATLDGLLADYGVTSLIAQGGMGAIYRGVQTRLDRDVAIKVLPTDFGDELNFAARFEQEAKAMARLSHSNIVGVYDYGETSDGSLLYFVMEFVAGTTLYGLIEEGDIPYDRTFSILKQICGALEYAHENGIVHRDIKPANILIDRSGNVKIADFGLAKLHKPGGEDEEETAFGTPDYVAPETLVEGLVVDQRADIFALGVITYEILTGKVPSADAKLASEVNADADWRFDELIAKAMDHDRDKRFATVAEFRQRLVEITTTPKVKSGAGKSRAPMRPAVKKAVRRPAAPGAAARRGAPAKSGVAARAAGPPTARPVAGARATAVPHPKSTSSNWLAISLTLLLIAILAVAYFGFINPPTKKRSSPGKDEPVTSLSVPPDETDESSRKQEKSERAVKLPPAPRLPKEAGRKTNSQSGSTGINSVPDPSLFNSNGGNSSAPAPPITRTATAPSAATPTAASDLTPGRIRAFGTIGSEGTPASAGIAEEFDDVVRIGARSTQWLALRAGGQLISTNPSENGLENIVSLDTGPGLTRLINREGALLGESGRSIQPGKLTNVVQSVGGYRHFHALLAGGTVVSWGARLPGEPRTPVAPPAPLRNVVDIAATQDCFAAVHGDGSATLWNQNLEIFRYEPETEGDGLIAVEAGYWHFVCLTRDGTVKQWAYADPDRRSRLKRPAEKAIAIRAGGATFAAQRSDGTWFAWGKNHDGIVDKINGLPPTPEIAFFTHPANEGFGFVLWIEPAGVSAPPVRIETAMANLKLEIRSKFDNQIEPVHQQRVIELNDRYLIATQQALTKAIAANEADLAKRFADELDRARDLTERTSVAAPVLVSGRKKKNSPPEWMALRDRYRSEYAKLREQRKNDARPLLSEYLQRLAALESKARQVRGEETAEKVRMARARLTEHGLDALLMPDPAR